MLEQSICSTNKILAWIILVYLTSSETYLFQKARYTWTIWFLLGSSIISYEICLILQQQSISEWNRMV